MSIAADGERLLMLDPPYYAVIFTSIRSGEDDEGYAATAARMMELAAAMPGFLGVESARERLGITVSYWKDLKSIRTWKQEAEHLVAQRDGRARWYNHYSTKIALVERAYGFDRNEGS